VPEKWAAAVHLDTTVDIHVDAFPGEIFQGKLVRINPTVSTDSRSFEIEAMIPNPGNKLKPGFFVQASLPSEIEEKIVDDPRRSSDLPVWNLQGIRGEWRPRGRASDQARPAD